MGVHGLTSFLKEHRRSLSYTLELARDDTPNSARVDGPDEPSKSINVVVDGWSLIYSIFYNSGEPWVYGGEYAALARHVEGIVSSWISVGIKPTFVLDGPSSPLKYPTVISRLQENCVKPANLFFRTSPSARSTSRSLAETRIIPPLIYQTILSTLLCMEPHVKVELADGEADSYIVALAGRLGAYVVGNDSDFLVLNCEGYKGYIPLEDMTWLGSPKDQTTPPPEPSAGDGDTMFEFQTVTKKKQKGRFKMKESRIELGSATLLHSLPHDSDVTLMMTVYEPATFAQQVSLPTSLLPLLGALIGNDYASFEFFRSTESATQRVRRVADTLSSVLKESQSGNTKKIRKVNRSGQESVLDVIGTTIERLLLWRDPANPPASGQVEKITEMAVQSTLEYALDNYSLALEEFHDEDQNDSEGSGPVVRNFESAAKEVRCLYLYAYRRGTLHSKILETFTRGSCFPRLFLEDPDRECCARSIGQPIREMIWSILSDGGGIPERPDPMVQEESEQDAQSETPDDDEELVDVVEEHSGDEISVKDDDDDPLAALRGKLQRLSFGGVETPDDTPDVTDQSPSETEQECQTSSAFMEAVKPPREKVVTEYVRRGARVVGEDLEVRQLRHFVPDVLDSAVPVQLRPIDERLRVFLQALGSDTHSIREIANEEVRNVDGGSKLLSIVTLRWVLRILNARAEAVEDGNRRRERNKEKWTRSEAQAFLACLGDTEVSVEQPSIDDRAVQLTAQILAAFEACGWLAQALLLVDLPDSRKSTEKRTLPVRMGEAEKLFSGRRFHAALGHSRRSPDESFHRLWDTVQEGLEDTFGEERGKKNKKRKDRNNVAVLSGSKAPTGMFGVLAELDVQ